MNAFDRYLWPATILICTLIVCITIAMTFGRNGRYDFDSDSLKASDTRTGKVGYYDTKAGAVKPYPAK